MDHPRVLNHRGLRDSQEGHARQVFRTELDQPEMLFMGSRNSSTKDTCRNPDQRGQPRSTLRSSFKQQVWGRKGDAETSQGSRVRNLNHSWILSMSTRWAQGSDLSYPNGSGLFGWAYMPRDRPGREQGLEIWNYSLTETASEQLWSIPSSWFSPV